MLVLAYVYQSFHRTISSSLKYNGGLTNETDKDDGSIRVTHFSLKLKICLNCTRLRMRYDQTAVFYRVALTNTTRIKMRGNILILTVVSFPSNYTAALPSKI